MFDRRTLPAITVFLGAFLLFEVQPMIGKYILPWFGGGPGVWTVCLLFFQVVLLLGYAYAHGISTRFSGRIQAAIHTGLLIMSLLFLPIVPRKPLASELPAREILLLLVATIGMPYWLLSSTGPLVQRWFHAREGSSPYRLYALSNAASLLALIAYPFVLEPLLPLRRQVRLWSWVYVLFVVLSSRTGILACPSKERNERPRPTYGALLYWLACAACGSTLLVATTNEMCQEVAVIPFLWVLPLTIYLLTFILAFDHERWYDRRLFGLLVGVMVAAACSVLAASPIVTIRIHIAILSLALLACCMICHGELVRSKPDPQHLTLFYLAVAAGGATGGIFVALVAPRIFSGYSELYIGMTGCSLLALAGWYRDQALPYRATAPVAGLLTALVVPMVSLAYGTSRNTLASFRNFYGILRVSEDRDEVGPKRTLTHGRITHGFQYTNPDKRAWPTSYYGRESAIGLAIENHPARDRPLKVGVVGLGTGTIATYGRPGDVFRFYEINPDVMHVADRYFTYLKDSRAKIELVLGDARVRLEQEAGQGFDILAVDAFSSDAIPLHLLTRECADLYRRHLKPDGLLLFHISNQSLELGPVTQALAAHLGLQPLRIVSVTDARQGTLRANWVVLSNHRRFLEDPVIRRVSTVPTLRPPLLWTDDFASLRQVLK